MTLRADDVVVRVGDAELLRGATLELRAGEVLAVVGPNGAGKSTLLRVLAGDRVPSAGSVTMEGRPLSAWSLSARALRRAVMGHDEEPAFPWLARELVLLGRLPRHGGAPSSRDHAIVARLLADVDAGALAERVHTTLSTGERQRIGLARALAQVWPDDLDPAEVAGATGADGTDRPAGSTSFAGSAGGDGGDGSTGFAEADGAAGAAGQTPGGPTRTPAWLLLDEPTSNLDLRHQAVALGLLRARAALGAGVLVVLHDINLAAAHADRIAIMHRGRIAASGSPAEVLRSDLLEQVFEVPMLVLPHPHLAHPLVIPDPTR